MALVDVAQQKDILQARSHQQCSIPRERISPYNVHSSPLEQFHAWFDEARNAGVREPQAMSLSTATPSGVPSLRTMFLKELDNRGFVFFTDYTSLKSQELDQNPNAALLFFWKEISRQVRIVGKVEKLSKVESEVFFQSRPIGIQLAALASKQSSIVGEEDLQEGLDEIRKLYEGTERKIPYPDYWGGWRVIPSEMEFWLGKSSRLHDRIRYQLVEGSSAEEPRWTIDRLAP